MSMTREQMSSQRDHRLLSMKFGKYILRVWRAMYSLVRKMDVVRNRLKSWCLDKRLFWGVNWRTMFNEFQHQGNQIQSIHQGASLVLRHRTLLSEASLAVTYWQQRIKDRHLRLGDIPSKNLFNRLRQKKQQNFVYMLRTSNGDWVEIHTT